MEHPIFSTTLGTCNKHTTHNNSLPSYTHTPHANKRPALGGLKIPLMVGIRSPDGLVVGVAPATLEFWVRFPNERNQGKQVDTLC
jgi:hypothetical protein